MKKSLRYSFFIIHAVVQFDQVILNMRRIVNSLWKHEYSKLYLGIMRSKIHSNISENRTRTANRKMILLDYFPFPHWISISSIAAKVIQEKTGSEIFAFGFIKPFKNTKDLYRAFGVAYHLQIKMGIRQWNELWTLYKEIALSISKSEDVFNIEMDSIKIGIPIYESILRSGKITVDIDDIETYKHIYRGLMQYVYFRKLFIGNRIEAILVSHDCYIGPGLLDHMAHRYGVISLNVNPLEINLPFKAGQLYTRFERYPEYFAALSLEDRDAGIKLAQRDLEWRLTGKIGVKMGYQEQSAFESNKTVDQLVKADNLKVLVATHDFYDNPHGYGKMLFNDFSIWLEFLSQVASETTYDWYLKCHKDSSLEQRKEIEAFSQRNPTFKVVDSLVSFHQLASEGLDFVLTCYGSVGHELPLLGINVLNSSYNPHIAYNFNYHAKSVVDYKELLLNLPELELGKISTNEIYEFFYVHHYLMWPDDYIFPSYEDYVKNSNLQSDDSLKYIISIYESLKKNINIKLHETIQNRRVFSVEQFLESSKQIKYPVTAQNVDFFDAFRD